jgi:3-oxoacyl-[acyl-carrier-protein] synthase-3
VRTAENIEMDGLGVLSFFNAVVPREIRSILDANGIAVDDIDVFVFHQASRIAMDSLVKLLGLPEEKVVCELESVGNLVSASIPHALQQALAKGTANQGDLAVLCGFGVGLSWGTAIVRL